MNEQYKPSPEDIKKAEERMSYPEKELSQRREQQIADAGGIDRLKEIYDGVDQLQIDDYKGEYDTSPKDCKKLYGTVKGHKLEIVMKDISDEENAEKYKSKTGWAFVMGTIDGENILQHDYEEAQKIVDEYLHLREGIREDKKLTKMAKTSRSVQDLL